MKTTKLQLSIRSTFFQSGIKLFLTVAIMIATHQLSFSQVPPIIFKNYSKLGIIQNQVDVYGSIVRCNLSNTNQVFIRIHNEIEIDQIAVFTLHITNDDNGNSFSQDYNLPIVGHEYLQADCENESEFKIDLPPSYKPQSTLLTISF